MAQQVQNFDFRFSKKESNSFYPNLINCVGIKPPNYNFGFRQKFTQSDSEKGDNGEFYMTKRKGFKKIKLYNYDGNTYTEENNNERLNGKCYDVCIVGGYRYFLYFNNEENKLRIYKHIGVPKGDTENFTNSKISSGYVVNITSYKGLSHFPADKSISKKFLLTTYVRGKIKDSGTGMGLSWRKGDTIINGFIDEDEQLSCTDGDYLFTDTGLVHVIGKSTYTIDKKKGALLATSWNKVIQISKDKNVKHDIEYKVFSDYGLTFHFVTSDGLVHRHYDDGFEGSMQYSFCGNVNFETRDNLSKPNFFINAMSNYNQSTIFLNDRGALFVGGVGFNKFFYSGLNIIQTTGVYTNIYEYMSNIILLGPKKIGYLIFDFNKNIGEIYELVSDGGTYSKYSVGIQDNKFLYVRDTKDFYSLKLSYGGGAMKPAIDLGYLSQFLNTDLEQLDYDINDVNISIEGNTNYIFINDGGENTKALFYDTYYALRVKRYITGCKIIGSKHGCFFGGGIFSNEGNTDNGNSITQIISSMFGNRTQSVSKQINYIKGMFGYNTYCTEKDSVFNAHLYDRGYEYTISYPLNHKGGYINNLFNISYDDENKISDKFVLSNKPIGIEILNCEGVFIDSIDDTLTSEFESYNNLGLFESKISNGNKYNIGKMGTMKFPIGQPCNVISFDVIARGDNKIEFGGFFIGFQGLDYDFSRKEDTASIGI